MKVAVLLGGTSAERDVSTVTGIAVARALKTNGHAVEALDCAFGSRLVDFHSESAGTIRPAPSDFEERRAELDRNIFATVEYLWKHGFDAVFNALHGGYGEDGRLSALLELAGIPCTGSGPLASQLAMDKHLSKIIFRERGVRVADWLMLERPEEIDGLPYPDLGLPLVIKPNAQGSTVGLSIIEDYAQLSAALHRALAFSERVMLERYVPGKELTVAVLGGAALPVLEIDVDSGFYDYEAKYQGGRTRYLVPAQIPEAVAAEIQRSAVSAFQALGGSGYARIDFRLAPDGNYFCLEANTLPGMTPTSLVPKAAKAIGIEFNELVDRILHLAVERR